MGEDVSNNTGTSWNAGKDIRGDRQFDAYRLRLSEAAKARYAREHPNGGTPIASKKEEESIRTIEPSRVWESDGLVGKLKRMFGVQQ